MTRNMLLAFVVVVCNGNLTEMIQTRSHLSWWNEWFLYFERLWGRTLLHWSDAADEYGLTNNLECVIFRMKLNIVLRCRASWPKYAKHLEDVAMRSEKWNNIIDDTERIIQHDGTAYRFMYKPSTAENQRRTYSQYNKGPVAKASVHVQIGGWVGGDHLVVGACSDSDHIIKNKVLEQQEIFQNNDLVGEKVIPFTMTLDRGYHLDTQAFRCGKQTIRQPEFKKTGRRFTGRETLRSASCSNIRAGNERAVRKAKLSGFLKKGILPGEDLERFDDAFLAWTFQVNFMYKPNM